MQSGNSLKKDVLCNALWGIKRFRSTKDAGGGPCGIRAKFGLAVAINKHNGRCFGDGRWGWVVETQDSQKPSDGRLQDVVEDKHALGTRGRGRYQRRDHVGLIAEVAWCHMPHPTIGA